MTTKTFGVIAPQTWRIAMAAATICLLAIPLVAMQFTAEVNWSRGDFLVAAILLAALWAGIEIALRMIRTRAGRLMAVVACVSVFLTIWVELAVGIFN